jgi:glycosyltransferase involved in cell wall biosynthesis
MRILLTIHTFPPMSWAGSQLSTYHLARGLGGLGHDVEVLHTEASDERGVERRVVDGVVCTVLRKPIASFTNVFGEEDPWVDRAFAGCVGRFRPDILHVNHLLYLSDNLPRIARSHGIPVVFTVRDYWQACPRLVRVDWRQRLCERATAARCAYCCRALYTRYPTGPSRQRGRPAVRAAKTAAKSVLWALREAAPAFWRMRRRRSRLRAMVDAVDWWIAPSEAHLAAMVARGVPADRAEVIRNPVPWTGEMPARAARSGRLRFGSLGPSTEPKGFLVLLGAFRGMEAADLDIYGARESRTGIPDEHRSVLDQDNVRRRGPVGEAGKAAALSSMDALIVPSLVPESGPRVVQEALAAGVPVIGSALGGITEQIREGVDGMLFPAGATRTLRAIIERCIGDPAFIRGLRPSAAAVPTVEQHARQVLAVYSRLARPVAGIPTPRP